jgi:hypothetical protein
MDDHPFLGEESLVDEASDAAVAVNSILGFGLDRLVSFLPSNGSLLGREAGGSHAG